MGVQRHTVTQREDTFYSSSVMKISTGDEVRNGIAKAVIYVKTDNEAAGQEVQDCVVDNRGGRDVSGTNTTWGGTTLWI